MPHDRTHVEKCLKPSRCLCATQELHLRQSILSTTRAQAQSRDIATVCTLLISRRFRATACLASCTNLRHKHLCSNECGHTAGMAGAGQGLAQTERARSQWGLAVTRVTNAGPLSIVMASTAWALTLSVTTWTRTCTTLRRTAHCARVCCPHHEHRGNMQSSEWHSGHRCAVCRVMDGSLAHMHSSTCKQAPCGCWV